MATLPQKMGEFSQANSVAQLYTHRWKRRSQKRSRPWPLCDRLQDPQGYRWGAPAMLHRNWVLRCAPLGGKKSSVTGDSMGISWNISSIFVDIMDILYMWHMICGLQFQLKKSCYHPQVGPLNASCFTTGGSTLQRRLLQTAMWK